MAATPNKHNNNKKPQRRCASNRQQHNNNKNHNKDEQEYNKGSNEGPTQLERHTVAIMNAPEGGKKVGGKGKDMEMTNASNEDRVDDMVDEAEAGNADEGRVTLPEAKR